MEDNKLKKYRDILIEERKRIENILENKSSREEEGIDNYPDDELSNVDNHPADIGTEVFMREQDEGFKASYKDTLKRIDNSLTNINDGSYGTCSSCSKEIEEERLKAIPYAILCSNCMKEEEDNKEKYESLEEEYITERSHSRENVQFDREDSYQDVAEYEKIPKDPSNSTGDYMGVMDDEEEKNTDDLDNISQEYYDETQK